MNEKTNDINHTEDVESASHSSENNNELQKIRDALETINKHKFLRALNSTPRMIWLNFLKGIAFGLGSVMGATIVVSILVALLAQIEFIPIIGEWTQMILEEIQQEE